MAVAVPEVLNEAFESLRSVDVGALADASLHDAVVTLRRHIDQLCAVEALLLSEWDARRVWADDHSRSPGHRLARETGLSVTGAKSLVSRARKLRSLPVISAAFADGALSASRVDLLLGFNTSEVAGVFCRDESLLVDMVSSLSFTDATKALKYWNLRANETAAGDRCSRQVRMRSAHASRSFHDMVDLSALFDPVNGEVFLGELERLTDELFQADWAEAKAQYGSEVSHAHLARTPAQRRCDALVEMAKRSAALPAGSHKPKPLITVLVGEESFKHLCELGSGAVLTTQALVPLLHEADIETVMFDGPRRVMGVTKQRSFRGAVRRAVEVRDRRCQHESGGDVPASRCQVDHIDPYARTRTTSERNGQLLCPTHNRLKGPAPP
jgi:hypothetical protein